MHKAPVTLNFNECYFLPLFSSPEATASVCPTDQELVESASDYFNPSAFSAMHKEADNKVSGKSVSFSKVSVREHCVILGDHPACDMLPLCLGWSHADEKTFDVDIYEQRKLKQRSGRSLYGSCQKLSFSDRMDTLKRLTGMDYSDIMFLERHRRLSQQWEQ